MEHKNAQKKKKMWCSLFKGKPPPPPECEQMTLGNEKLKKKLSCQETVNYFFTAVSKSALSLLCGKGEINTS